MSYLAMSVDSILGAIILLSSVGVIAFKKPVHSCLSFLLTLVTLAAFYLELSAPFLAVMQVLVYAGAILVIFMFIIVLFQDAHAQIPRFQLNRRSLFLAGALMSFIFSLASLATQLKNLAPHHEEVALEFGSAKSLGLALYTDFSFPFEAVGLLFLIASIGALYIGKKVS